jgi:hypothetical protein
MRRLNVLFVVAGALVGLLAANHLPLRAQGDGKPVVDAAVRTPTAVAGPARELTGGSIQDALLRPYHFPFGRPTTLNEVGQRLSQDLGSPVVLDLAALERQDVKPDDTVKLELTGVRLKTGLKLLLDQVRLTVRVVPEDNLLIVTDHEGSEDPIERVMAEIHELHRDVHDIQDSLDEVRELTGLQGPEGARVRKPTIIEEMPENQDMKPHDPNGEGKPVPKLEPGVKPPGQPSSRPRTSL